MSTILFAVFAMAPEYVHVIVRFRPTIRTSEPSDDRAVFGFGVFVFTAYVSKTYSIRMFA